MNSGPIAHGSVRMKVNDLVEGQFWIQYHNEDSFRFLGTLKVKTRRSKGGWFSVSQYQAELKQSHLLNHMS